MKALLIILLIPVLSACGLQKPAQKQAVEKPATSQRVSIREMDPQFLYLASQDAIKEGNHLLAIKFLSALIEQDPGAIGPRLQLATLLMQSGQPEKAEVHLAALAAVQSLNETQREQLQLLQIRLLFSQSRMEAAKAALGDFLKQHPANTAARDMQIRVLSNEKRYDEALDAVAEAIKQEEKPEFLLLQAQLLIRTDALAAAKASLMRLQQLSPDNDTAPLLLSAIALQEKNPDEAETVLRDFLQTHPDAFRISHALGKILIKSNRLVEAILVYRDAAAVSGNNPAILRPLGMLYFQHKDFAEAEQVFRKLLDIQSDDMSRFYLATSLEALNRDAEARVIYEQIDADSAMAIDAQLRLAAIEVNHDEIDKASRRLKKVLRKKPAHLDAHLMLSAIRLTQKRYQQMLDETESLLSMDKLPAQLLFNRAVAFDHFKQYDQVEAMLDRILLADPNHTDALNFLGYTYAIQSIKLKKAKNMIEHALRLKPDDGYYLDSLAWVYYQSADYANAIKMQRKALQQISDDAIMHEHFGDMLWKNGDFDPARKAWEKAIELNSENPKRLKKKIKQGLE